MEAKGKCQSKKRPQTRLLAFFSFYRQAEHHGVAPYSISHPFGAGRSRLPGASGTCVTAGRAAQGHRWHGYTFLPLPARAC